MIPRCILRVCFQNRSSCLVRNFLSKNPRKLNKNITTFRYFTTSKPDEPKKDPNLYRHFYHEESEAVLNEQIDAELNACYTYLAIASHFGRSDVAFPGCYAFFFQMHLEELGHAHNLIRYQNMRGGKVLLCGLNPIGACELNIQQSFEKGLQMEKEVKEKLVKVYTVAEKHKDTSLSDFIVSDYIQAQEKSIQEYARLLHRYKAMAGCGMCSCIDFLFDKELHAEFIKGTNQDELKFSDNEKAFK